MAWNDDQNWESNWWGTCANTYNEETKQIVYARKMGLVADWDYGKYPVYDMGFKTIIDIGGGPVSMLLKCKNIKQSMVADPCSYPEWIEKRYSLLGIQYIKAPAENLISKIDGYIFDEAWIYNVLQHTIDPEQIIKNAKSIAKIIRIFEWVDTGIAVGHPHDLKEEKLNIWLGGEGKVENIHESGCVGKCYFGIFKGDHYASI